VRYVAVNIVGADAGTLGIEQGQTRTLDLQRLGVVLDQVEYRLHRVLVGAQALGGEIITNPSAGFLGREFPEHLLCVLAYRFLNRLVDADAVGHEHEHGRFGRVLDIVEYGLDIGFGLELVGSQILDELAGGEQGTVQEQVDERCSGGFVGVQPVLFRFSVPRFGGGGFELLDKVVASTEFRPAEHVDRFHAGA